MLHWQSALSLLVPQGYLKQTKSRCNEEAQCRVAMSSTMQTCWSSFPMQIESFPMQIERPKKRTELKAPHDKASIEGTIICPQRLLGLCLWGSISATCGSHCMHPRAVGCKSVKSSRLKTTCILCTSTMLTDIWVRCSGAHR